MFEISAGCGEGLEPWFESMLAGEIDAIKVFDIDYEQYGDGEALLGLVERIVADDELDGNGLLLELASDLRRSLADRGFEVAHLKATISTDEAPSKIAAVNLMCTETKPELSHRLVEQFFSD